MPKRAAIVLVFASPCLNACGDTPGEVELPADPGQLGCNLPVEYMVSSSVGRDGIPSLQDPEFVSAEPSPQNAYLREDDRVLGFFLDGQPRAVPHNILWYHEVVNLDAGSERIAVTYCPLTGSPLGFDRTSIGGHTLGVSGFLVMNNLIMYNRGSPESFWPQMFAEARCGAEVGRPLGRIPVFEMEWQAWKILYPRTTVVSSEANISRNYAVNPYGDYDSIENEDFLYSNMPALDGRRPVKERVLRLPAAGDHEPGIAFPYQALEAEPGSWTAVATRWNGVDAVVFWADQRGGGGVFRPLHPVTGEKLVFRADPVRGIVDTATETSWSITGEGRDGELAGLRLTPVAEAYVAFWGAWAAFHPETRLWEREATAPLATAPPAPASTLAKSLPPGD